MLQSVWGGVWGGRGTGLGFAGMWGPFGDQNGWKRRSWMRYTARIRFVARFFWFSGRPRWAQSVGPERSWKLDASQVRWSQELGALWEAKMRAIWGLLGHQVGPFRSPKWVRRAFCGAKIG